MKKQNGRSSRFGLHRAAYHRHFEGYSEYEVVDENGYAHIKRVYTGMYYTHPLEGRRRVLLKALFSALWAAAAVLFILAAAQRGVGSHRPAVAIWQALAVVGLAWAFLGLVHYLAEPRTMTVGEWRDSSQKLKRGSLIAALFLWAAAPALMLHLLRSAENPGRHLLCAGCFLLAGACMFALWLLERRIVYTLSASEERAPEYAARIR